MPELILATLARKCDVQVRTRHTGGAMEVVNLLRLARGTHALLAEPAATLAVQTGQGALVKNLDLSSLWLQVFPEQEILPTAALIVVGKRAGDAQFCKALCKAFARGMSWAEQHPEEGRALTQSLYPELDTLLSASPDLAKSVLQSSRLLGAENARLAGTFLLQQMFEQDPASIGGRMPGKDFWELENAGP